MILLKLPEEAAPDHKYISAFRWVLEASRWKDGVGIGAVGQSRSRDDGEWRYAHQWYGVTLTSYYDWGTEHSYYDGPNCSLSLGWLHIIWTGNPFTGWCEKCMPSSEVS